MKAKIGFIGLGIMGKPMAKNLLKAEYGLVVHDVNRAAVAELVTLGAEAAGSPAAVARVTERIILMLPNSPEVRQVLTGPDGVLSAARPGTLVIDMSSISPLVAREMGEALKQHGLDFLDAPVSGGEPGAVNATLSIMVGGADAVFNGARELLGAMGKSVVRVGDVGSGNIAKLANQVMVAVHVGAMAEALVLAAKAGVDPRLVFQAIRGGLAGSNVLEAKAERVLARNFTPGFKVDLHAKDLANALDTARQIGAPLLLTAQAMEVLKALQVAGQGRQDHAAMVNFYERLAGVEVRGRSP